MHVLWLFNCHEHHNFSLAFLHFSFDLFRHIFHHIFRMAFAPVLLRFDSSFYVLHSTYALSSSTVSQLPEQYPLAYLQTNYVNIMLAYYWHVELFYIRLWCKYSMYFFCLNFSFHHCFHTVVCLAPCIGPVLRNSFLDLFVQIHFEFDSSELEFKFSRWSVKVRPLELSTILDSPEIDFEQIMTS